MNPATALTRDFTEKVLATMGFEAEVSAELIGSEQGVQVDTKDQALLIGKGGENLKALQYLIHQMVVVQMPDAPMVTVDVAEYRKSRLRKLDEIIGSAKNQITNDKTYVELDPMNAYERRYVHGIIAENEGLTSESKGEEPARFVVIQKSP